MEIMNAIQEVLAVAGEIQMSWFSRDVFADQKENQSNVVTRVDLECEKAIISIITSNFPGHNILSEESGFIFKGSDHTWIIDPLDGTSNFVAGFPWFGCLVSLLKGSKPTWAGASLPVEKKIYLAEKGKGAFVNGKRLSIQEKELSNSLVGFSMDKTSNQALKSRALNDFEKLIQTSRNTRATNSLHDFLSLAENKLGLCLSYSNKIWDIAAPSLIIEEAGGVFIEQDKPGLELHTFDPGYNYTILAGSFKCVEEFMNIGK